MTPEEYASMLGAARARAECLTTECRLLREDNERLRRLWKDTAARLQKQAEELERLAAWMASAHLPF